MAYGKINIAGVVNDIKSQSVYFPIIEGIVNSIQAINEATVTDGKIVIKITRSKESKIIQELDIDTLGDIESFEIIDNGIGFNQKNLDSFETFRSGYKLSMGGKGFGRFFYLKFFESVNFESVYEEEGEKYKITFDFCINSEEMATNKKIEKIKKHTPTGTKLFLNKLKRSYMENLNSKSKNVDTFARKLLEHLLIYFIEEKNGPNILVTDGVKSTSFDELIGSGKEFERIHEESFSLLNNNININPTPRDEKFKIKIFKVQYGEANHLGLCANNRLVTEESVGKYIPDFLKKIKNTEENGKNYTIKAYITGNYLDDHVETERDKFDFHSDYFNIGTNPILEKDIILIGINKIKKVFEIYLADINIIKEKDIRKFVTDKAPRYNTLIKDLDLDSIELGTSSENLDRKFHEVKYFKEKETKAMANAFFKTSNFENKEEVRDLVNKLDDLLKTDLAHYVATRKYTLDLFGKALQRDNSQDKNYSSEDHIHSIIFPTKRDTESVEYKDHNLWILDEKLNFTEFISSDKPLNGGTTERTDLIIYDRKIAFRGDNTASNPITVFEFKKPGRDDFVNPSSDEDPVQQIIRYVNDIIDQKYKAPGGLEINVATNTPFYGYVVCTLTKKVKDRLQKVKDFKPMPDGKGWFMRFSNINLYVEVLSRDKVFEDAQLRNKIFFEKLKI